MSQQSEFEYAEQTSHPEQLVNTDLHEQPGGMEAQNRPPDYVAARPMGDQKIYPQRPRRRRRWLWVLIVVIVLLALLSGGGYFSNSVFSKTQMLPQQAFTVSGTPNLVIDDVTGAVKIHQGASNRVVIEATAHGSLFSNFNNDTVNAKQDGNSITILVGEDGSILNHGNVDLDITLPASSNIQATVNAGDLDINGVSGQMNLNVKTGALNFENGTAEGQSLFRDNLGAINFNGSIAPNGTYDFEGSVGAINLNLPSDVPFTLDATSKIGKVNNDFGSNVIGDKPNSHVHVHTDVGTINIHKQQ